MLDFFSYDSQRIEKKMMHTVPVECGFAYKESYPFDRGDPCKGILNLSEE